MNVAADSAAREAARDPSTELSRFALDLRREDIPEAVLSRAAHHVLDAVGIAFASSRYDFAHRTLTGLRGLSGEGAVPVIGLPDQLPPRDAAVMNGLLCHGLDFDDTHLDSVVHPTACAFPAALSAGVLASASGEAVLLAYIVGVEAATRIGAAARGGFHAVGFHPTGVANAFGAALTAGRLLGCTARELRSAQGITVSLASGTLEFLEDGAWNKRLHPGWAASAGITAAALARQGFAGTGKPYMGRFGLYRTHLGPNAEVVDPTALMAGLGERWEIARTSIKPFPACHFAHACIDAALVLHAQGLRAEAVDSVLALVPREVVPTVCEPAEQKRRPAGAYEAQFSIPFLVAAALVRGRMTLAELEAEALNDPVILALAARVSYAVDPDSPFPRSYSGEIRVRARDGREWIQREAVNRGAPDRLLEDAEIVAKFRANAALCLNDAAAARIEDAVLGLVRAGDLRDLCRALSPS
ncbi:MmgE/PrpD family protein [Roseomonas marmotae]|uniref:MmgE/PrpD family protein n=1 Tax=Roseomonas marmotae TaxID=2768161 RepID=A0ABS3KI87_9PROT|nr:MmgE/PrpD family protein [Roseomonas marmotae]